MGEMEASQSDGPLVCLGEALVDLICPEPVDHPAAARSFEAHFGGALANVAVAASMAGASAALAGACGSDDWGRFLRERLVQEDVGLDFHSEVEGLVTPFAFATLDANREPSFRIHGDGIEDGIATLGGREGELLAAAGAVVLGSNTLVGERGRAVTFAVAEGAEGAGVPVLFDPNLRPGRWVDLEAVHEMCLDLIGRTTVLKCNLREARWLAGSERSPGEVAEELVALGPRLVVVTTGPEGAVARGSSAAQVGAPEVEMVSPLGAGDCFMGTLAAGLLGAGCGLDNVGPALERAAGAGTSACTRLGTFD